MISPELLRGFPHFSGVSYECLKDIAMISRERDFDPEETLFHEGNLATHLCLMLSGEVSIVYRLGDNREVVADNLIKGDAFGWSAILEPHQLTASCRGAKSGKFIAIEAEGLRRICDEDYACGYHIVRGVSKALRDRLSAMRVQIAAGQ
ncbi:MAG: cyclic nucleotide-binding domain-containing protein [Anaerolineales bacterium]|jgi:CRP/FNR family cyclic AMP-dependent transcriptional regulator|nr:cyclic nucleotide-binding domain-containing protein [Anaerolineales bacterium]